MTLPTINLDDRRFNDLVEEAKQQFRQSCPAWSDGSASDPGLVLLEVFAHLTEVMLYRLNRLPQKVHIELLNLLGISLRPPAAATTELRFTLPKAASQDLIIPAGTQVTAKRYGAEDEPPVFTTIADAVIKTGNTEVATVACHARYADAELLGTGSGKAAQTLFTKHDPVTSIGKTPEMVIGIEHRGDSLTGSERAIESNGKSFVVWFAVDNFSDQGQGRRVFQLDRYLKRVQFAPEISGNAEATPECLADIPDPGAQIRAWYWYGGGTLGNVAANTLTELNTPLHGVQVTNPTAAVGGRDAETLDNALNRGPQEIHSLQRAVTARDFELFALRTGSVDRAQAYTKAAQWHHATPGTVEILILPHIPVAETAGGPVTSTLIQSHCEHNSVVLDGIRKELEIRRPLGTQCLVNWTHCKSVRVKAQLVVFKEENANAVKARVLDKLNAEINPLPRSPDLPGWSSGQSLTSWNVYRIIGSEPGIKAINSVRLVVDSAPDSNVQALGVDAFQHSTWYAGSGNTLFRSVNNGEGWEPIHTFDNEVIVTLAPYDQPTGIDKQGSGLVALVTSQESRSRIHLSRDCGEQWEILQPIAFRVNAIAWLERNGRISLLLAAERGLFELDLDKSATPDPILVDEANPDLGFHDVVVAASNRSPPTIAVAANRGRGVFLSQAAGRTGSFKSIGLERLELRVLSIQYSGTHQYLWAGFTAPGEEAGEGCMRLRLTDENTGTPSWQSVTTGWDALNAGSCLALAFTDNRAFAATSKQGVLMIDTDRDEASWLAPGVDSKLPLREVGRYQRVEVIATNPAESRLMAGGNEGIFISTDLGQTYKPCAQQEFENEITLPPNWLLCSSEHEIEVVNEDASH